ncbi:MAG TPA: SRPBCC family protein [Acidimicrobiales bacterium]
MPRTDTASRVIAAQRKLVYEALVDPDALRTWLPPSGMTGRFEHFDMRPGGSYRMALTYADGGVAPGKSTPDSDIVDVRIIDIAPEARVVQSVKFVSDDPSFAGVMTLTWELTAVEGGTRVEVTAENVPDGISKRDHSKGMASSLVNLAEYLKA